MRKIILFIGFCLIVSHQNCMSQYTGEQCIVSSGFIYHPGDVVFPGCHASTIIETNKGLLAAWFGGTAERNPDVGIWISHFRKESWSAPVEVANGIQHRDKRYPCWNPVLYNTGTEVLLFFKVGPSPSTWWGELMTSENNGKTWTRPFRLPEDIIGPVKNKPVLLGNGELLCPSSTEHDGWRLHMEFTIDNGRTWERTPPLNEKSKGAIQPSILIHPGGILQLICRSTTKTILTSWSEDNGRNWSELISSGLPNPNSGIDAVTLKDGRYLMVYNHQVTGRNFLNVAVSDDGVNWKACCILENDREKNEYSYPAIIQASDGLIHITYTWQRKLIRHVVIDPAKIAGKDYMNGEWPD